MTDLADFVRYSSWASQKLLRFALTIPEDHVTRTISNSHGGILKTFQHVYYADRSWLARLQQASPASFEDAAPGPSLADMDAGWWPLLAQLEQMAESVPASQITQFRRLNGDCHSLPFGELITHIVNHGTYHRGQIAAMLRRQGHVPPSTDFLFYRLKI